MCFLFIKITDLTDEITKREDENKTLKDIRDPTPERSRVLIVRRRNYSPDRRRGRSRSRSRDRSVDRRRGRSRSRSRGHHRDVRRGRRSPSSETSPDRR